MELINLTNTLQIDFIFCYEYDLEYTYDNNKRVLYDHMTSFYSMVDTPQFASPNLVHDCRVENESCRVV